MQPRAVSLQSTMTLSVTPSDAKRVLEASRALDERTRQLGQNSAAAAEHPSVAPTFSHDSDDDPAVPKRVVSTSDHGSVASDDAASVDATGLGQVIVEAASSCGNPLLATLVRGLEARGMPLHEIQTCLLLFVRSSKSVKLRTAFRTLRDANDANEQERETICRQGALSLFKCFLTAISSCLQYKDEARSDVSLEPPAKVQKATSQSSPSSVLGEQSDEANPVDDHVDMPRASPSFDSSMEGRDGSNEASKGILNEATRNEIDEIAAFATDRLMAHVKNASCADDNRLSYESFGAWYGSGGFETVPWLELLDLSKWANSSKEKIATETESSAVSLPSISEEANRGIISKETSPAKKPAPGLSRGTTPSNGVDTSGRVLISFDFTGAMGDTTPVALDPSLFCIDVSDMNLHVLRQLVHGTGLATRAPSEVSNILMKHATPRMEDDVLVLGHDSFDRSVQELLGVGTVGDSNTELELSRSYLRKFFSFFEVSSNVNLKEIAIAFSFLCAGSKSAKLSFGFELMDDERSGRLSKEQLRQYLRPYLAMLVGISLLSSMDKEDTISEERHKGLVAAVDKGAEWTVRQMLKHFAGAKDVDTEAFTFEMFASWYTSGGYNVAPWLELLDLSKLLGLLDEDEERRKRMGLVNAHHLPVFTSPRRPVQPPSMPPVDVLFTFPLANRRSLIVLREDAVYVRSVVEKLGLTTTPPDDAWSSLFSGAKKRPALPSKTSDKPRQRKPGKGKSMDVDQASFVECMESVVDAALNSRKRPRKGKINTSKSVRDTLVNFFQSFDLDQIDRVALNQLMGGLSLLCDGKKSTKLAFAFGLFDNSNNGTKSKNKVTEMPSLNGEELFLFLRSFLIVTFSCCRQSMDLSAEAVGRYISDTAHMVAEDVMRYQWQSRKRDRVDFDEFGEWYNDGGFETAPWLELLDLRKWVLVDDLDSIQKRRASASTHRSPHGSSMADFTCPPAPPDDVMDSSFFADDEHPMMPMDSIDEMDLMLLQQPTQDKENDGFDPNRTLSALLASPKRPSQELRPQQSSSLKFQLITSESHGGYMLSVSPRRVSHLRHILIDSGLCQVDAEDAVREIVRQASSSDGKDDSGHLTMNKEEFDESIRGVLSRCRGKSRLSFETQGVLSDLFASLFHAFERFQPGNPNAREVACGFTILCRGKKSDKLEFAFDLLEQDRKGSMTRRQLGRYLSSFLAVLLSITTASCLESDGAGEDSLMLMNGDRCDRSMLGPAVDAGAEWATDQAFLSRFKTKRESDTLSFDDFADWYTKEGFSNIPWLELLDLRKWVLTT